MSKKKERQTML